MNSYEPLKQEQQRWATSQGIKFDEAGYVEKLGDNLISPLSDATEAEFAAGKGAEMDMKMRALHSSSALAYNFFEPWRLRDKTALGRALGIETPLSDLQFERTFRTGLQGTAPHLDVVFSSAKTVAVESKFTEIYQKLERGQFSDSYFPETELWGQFGLAKCQSLAHDLREGRVIFERLGAVQLLKHILGLANQTGRHFTLIYLWFEHPSDEARGHRMEINQFKTRLDEEIDLRVLTYQELFARLDLEAKDLQVEIDYLRRRYFSA